MRNKEQQITSSGIANQKGLEVFRTAISYSGEFINWGNALAYGTQLGSDTEYGISGDVSDVQFQTLTDNPPTDVGRWYRYKTTDGTNHVVGTAPTSGSGFFTLNASSDVSKQSYAGMYQQMSLTKGNQYEIQITNTIDSDAAQLYVSTYFPTFNFSLNKVSYKVGSTAIATYPMTSSSTCILTSTFTATTPDDIIILYLNTIPTVSTATASINITNISVKEKQESLIPVYSEDAHGNAEKVLRRNLDNLRFNS